MKDRQVEQYPPALRIPILSPILHCVSMTVVVFLRSSFGFAYLRPKSIFLVFSWAMLLFTIYAWNEPHIWARYRFVCVFGISSAALYCLHLLISFLREIYRKGEHDHSSGRSHLLRLMGKASSPSLEMRWHIWAEPLLVLVAALALRLIWHETKLSTWLFFAAPSLNLKEALNFWFQLRQKKRHLDSQDDAGDIFDEAAPDSLVPEAPKPARRERIKRTRTSRPPLEDEILERRFAEILRLTPPYSLKAAERSYRKLIKEAYPHPNHPSEAKNMLAVQLNEAIAYFRQASIG